MSKAPDVLREIEGTGSTINAAIEAALKIANKERDDVMVEILDKPRSGFLGIGAQPARIKISFYEPGEEIPEPPKPEKKPIVPTIDLRSSASKPKTDKQPAKVADEKEPKSAPVVSAPKESEKKNYVPATSSASVRAKEFVKGLLDLYGTPAEITALEDDERNLLLELSGESMGAVIGRRGDTLDAIQYLTSLIVNQKEEKHYRVILDTENYRAKREESLERLARKIAGKVVKYKKSMTLEPMNPYERRIIHSALQDFKGVTTYSTGSEPNRRIVVALAGSRHHQAGKRS